MTERLHQKAVIINQIPFEYTLLRSKKRRRSLALAVEPENQIIIRAPWRTSLNEAEAFLHKNHAWILKHHAFLKERPQAKSIHQWEDGELIPYLGKFYPLHIIDESFGKARVHLHDDRIVLHLPLVTDDTLKASLIEKTMIQWYKTRTREIVESRIHDWAEKLGVRFNQLIISSPHKRWGSCNWRNDIRINWRVVLTPIEAIDYLIAHELSHVKHKNHSERFWRLLGSVMPDHEERQQILRKLNGFLSLG